MFRRGIWLGESEDKLRITPCPDHDRSTTSADQRLARALDRNLIGMSTDEERAIPDAFFPTARLIAGQSGPLERSRDVAGNVPSRFTERGRERTVSDDRANARNDHSHGRSEVGREFTQARCRARILDFRAGRRSRRVRHDSFFVVAARDNRNPLARDAKRAERAGGRGGVARIWKES
jgi:hypothetical protein